MFPFDDVIMCFHAVLNQMPKYDEDIIGKRIYVTSH